MDLNEKVYIHQWQTPACILVEHLIYRTLDDVLNKKILQECINFSLFNFSLKSKRGIFFHFYFNSRKAV